MKVRLESGQALAETALFDRLARVVQAIGDGWHDWVGPDPTDSSLKAYFEQYRTHHDLLAKSYKQSLAYPLPDQRTIVLTQEAAPLDRLSDETQVTFDVGAVLLTQPLPVLVENEVNDGAFYLKMIEIVDARLADRAGGPRPPYRLENGGGKTVMTQLVAHRAQVAAAAGIPLRLLVIADSDACYPGHTDKDTQRLRTICHQYGASLFVLSKRSIENYVFDSVLGDMAITDPNVSASVEFILSLSSVVRDHYPIKKGISSSNGKACVKSDDERKLYDSVTFPADAPVRVRRVAEAFTTSTRTFTPDDLADRDCLEEITNLSRWLRGEL